MNWSDFTTATAPWWFVALLAGTLSIVSTLLGAVVSLWSTAASDRRRGRSERAKEDREAHRAWCQTVRELTAAFIVSSREFAKTVEGQYVREDDGAGQIDWRRAPQLAADLSPAFLAYWELVLAADAETGQLAKNLMRQIRRYDTASPGETHLIDNREWTSMRAAVVSARGELTEHVMHQIASASPAGLVGPG